MSHQVVYRKYRSQDFSELIGQEHIAKTLSNQILEDSIGHAYLFFGPRGCGKTSTARIFAKSVNCLNPKNEENILLPCNECESCINFTSDDMDIIEMDAASNRGIDDARLLRDKVYSQPIGHKFKVIILDEAHMLTREAVNALLKIIEEPPTYMIFIFCTTEFHKIPVTIASRCQRFKFLFAQKDDLIKKLRLICEKEGKTLSDSELYTIATIAKGSFRDSESLLEQVIYSNNDSSFKELFNLYNNESNVSEFVNGIISNDIEKVWNILLEMEEAQTDVKQLLEISLEQAKRMLEDKTINFNEYLQIVKIVGSFRTGGKEEFMYKLLSINSSTNPNVSSIEIKTAYSQTAVESAKQPDKPNLKVNNYTKSTTLDSKTIKNDTLPVQKSETIEENLNRKNGELSSQDVLLSLKDKSSVYSMLQKSEIIIENKTIIINVTSTVSKLLLNKNKVRELLLSYYQGEIIDVKIEVVKSNGSGQSTAHKTAGDDNNDEIEKLFGTKLQ